MLFSKKFLKNMDFCFENTFFFNFNRIFFPKNQIFHNLQFEYQTKRNFECIISLLMFGCCKIQQKSQNVLFRKHLNYHFAIWVSNLPKWWMQFHFIENNCQIKMFHDSQYGYQQSEKLHFHFIRVFFVIKILKIFTKFVFFKNIKKNQFNF